MSTLLYCTNNLTVCLSCPSYSSGVFFVAQLRTLATAFESMDFRYMCPPLPSTFGWWLGIAVTRCPINKVAVRQVGSG